MASTRLLEWHRRDLRALANRVIDCPAEMKAEEAAYQRAAPMVRKIVRTKFPPVDMAILAKYEVTRTDPCINLQFTAGGVDQFLFRKDDDVPSVPRPRNCSNRVYLTNERETEAVQKWLAAYEANKKALETKRETYRSFIETASTFEQILAIWPEAEELKPRFVKNLPIALNDEAIAAITADSQRRLRHTTNAAKVA